MKLLAIDAATERCSAALLVEDAIIERSADVQRGHAELILPMIADLLAEARVSLGELDGLAYGRGPGAFTGVRIAVGVAQGLAYGAGLSTIGVSTLRATAQQIAQAAERVLVCMDARMGEVYWGRFARPAEAAIVEPLQEERVSRPEDVSAVSTDICVGSGFRAYPILPRTMLPPGAEEMLPRAREIAVIGAAELRAGRGQPASAAAPVYLRDQVAAVKRS